MPSRLPDQSKVAVTPPAIMRCPMAQQIADWVRDDVAPTLKGLPPLRGLDNLASYDCRGRNNVHAAKVSEHGRADALDVHDFKLADGRELGLTDVNIPKDWREAMRASACARFATVLGPGSDGYHEEHVHLDLEPRRNNYKICEWDVREPPPVVAQNKNQDTAAEPRRPTRRQLAARASRRRAAARSRCAGDSAERGALAAAATDRSQRGAAANVAIASPIVKKEPGFAPDSLSRSPTRDFAGLQINAAINGLS